MKAPIHANIVKAVKGLPISAELLPEVLKQLQAAVDWGFERGQMAYDDEHLKICLGHRIDACFCTDVGQLPECARCVAIQGLLKILDHPKEQR